MKDIRFNLLAILSLVTCLCACTADEASWSKSSQGISATIIDHEIQTRAIAIDNPGFHLDIYWQENDHIGLFGTGATNADFVLAANSLTGDNKTALFEPTDKTPTGDIIAYAPYQAGATSDGNNININIASEQKFTWAMSMPQPDPNSIIMLAKGSRAGLSFHPVMAVLKIGKMFDEDTKLKSIEFRDLANKPVCGSAVLTWKDGAASCEVTGSGNVLKLTDAQPLSIREDELRTFYLTVPARNYDKGFEITFVTDQGKRIVQTVGLAHGKELQRGIVYPVGDFVPDVQITDVEYEMMPNTIMMTPENLDKINIDNKSYRELHDLEGGVLYNIHGNPTWGYELDMTVSKDLHPVEGGWMIFNQPSDELPNGGVFRVQSVRPSADNSSYNVYLVPETNPFAPFKRLELGKPIYDADGTFHEDAGVPLDFNGKLSKIVDMRGKSVDFSISPTGEIVLDEEAVAQMLDVDTRAVSRTHNMSVSTPNFSICASGDNAEANFSPQLQTDIRTAIGVIDGELQYICTRMEPVFNFESSFTLKAGYSVDKSVHLVTLCFTPVMVPPGITFNFEIELSLNVGAGGEISFTTSLSSTQDLGSYTISYNKGDGFLLRTNREPTTGGYTLNPPSVTGNTSLYAYAGINAVPALSVFAMASIGLSCDINVKASLSSESNKYGLFGGTKFTIGPEIQLTPRVAMGGILPVKWAHNFKELTMKFTPDPWYEQYYLPEILPTNSVVFNGGYNYKCADEWVTIHGDGGDVNFQPRLALESTSYTFALAKSCPSDVEVGMAYYEITNYDVSFEKEADKEFFKRGYIKGLYGMVSITPRYYPDNRPGYKELAVQHLGTYPALTEYKEFTGSIAPPADLHLKEHTIYCAVPVLLYDGKIAVFIYDSGLHGGYGISYLYIQGLSDPNGVPYEKAY